MYSMTVFESRFDNTTNKRFDFDTWDKFSKFLYKLSERPLKGKTNAELISPATYVPGTTRANANVVNWASWAAVDIDDHAFEGNLEDALKLRFGSHNFICYSTASSTNSLPKFRLVFPLKTPLEGDRIKAFWFALNTELDSLGDKQTKDLSRMYYVPAQYDGANNFIFNNTAGSDIDPDYLIAKHPYVEKKTGDFMANLPDEWRKQIIEHRKASLENTEYRWSGYRDCPFVNKKLLGEYIAIANIDNTGRYRMFYKLMCSIAGNAIDKQYPMTPNEIVELVREIDRDTANRYQKRSLEKEANNALEYAYKNGAF